MVWLVEQREELVSPRVDLHRELLRAAPEPNRTDGPASSRACMHDWAYSAVLEPYASLRSRQGT
jgi:hypothetical protein